MRNAFIAFSLSLISFFTLTVSGAFAASTTLGMSPQSGSFGKPFSVDLVIDGHGDKFNAAQATVNLSANLKMQNLVLGDCNFSFLTTPSLQNPSFAGVILSSSATNCTVYTLTLVPVAKGNGSISLTKASVRRYGDAVNVLSSTQNGTYTLTAALKAPAEPSTNMMNSQNGLYTVVLKISSSQDTPVTPATVLLKQVSGTQQQQATTDATGTVQFSNLKTGIYDATIEENNTKVGENIINVSGANHVLMLGINLKGEHNNPLLKSAHPLLTTLATSPFLIAGMLLIGVTVGTVLALVLTKLKGRKTIPV